MGHVLPGRDGRNPFIREVHRGDLLEDLRLLVRRDLAVVVAVPCPLTQGNWGS